MKKIICLIIVFGMLICLTGCLDYCDTYNHTFFCGSVKVKCEEIGCDQDDELTISIFCEGNYTFYFYPDTFKDACSCNDCDGYNHVVNGDCLRCCPYEVKYIWESMPDEVMVKVFKDGICECYTFVDG